MNKATMKMYCESDLFRYTGNVSKKHFFKQIFLNPGFKYMFLFRRCKYYKGKNYLFYIIYRLLLQRYSVKYGYEIPHLTEIGKGFYIGHIGGIAINPQVKIGDNVNISKGVTIGQTNRGYKKGCPRIGDNVWIGSNAVIVGNINIERNVLIAPGAYVNFDIPENSLVIGNPAQIIYSRNATEGYINNIYDKTF